MNERKIPVLELFGPTVQGEGMLVGCKTMFVRTAGCDYRCSWCDSAFTWDGSARDEIVWMTAAQIIASLRELAGGAFAHVTLSGGNPALLPQLGALIHALHDDGAEVALETQGSRWQDWFMEIDDLTLSPKPPSSGMSTDWERLDEIIARLDHGDKRYCLKVVVFDEQDLAYAAALNQRYAQATFYVQAGNDQLAESNLDQLLPHLLTRYRWLIEQVMLRHDLQRVRVLPQLHTWVWGNKKGV